MTPRVIDGLRNEPTEDVVVVGGATIPQEDAGEFKSKGVVEVIGPGTREIVDSLRGAVVA